MLVHMSSVILSSVLRKKLTFSTLCSPLTHHQRNCPRPKKRTWTYTKRWTRLCRNSTIYKASSYTRISQGSQNTLSFKKKKKQRNECPTASQPAFCISMHFRKVSWNWLLNVRSQVLAFLKHFHRDGACGDNTKISCIKFRLPACCCHPSQYQSSCTKVPPLMAMFFVQLVDS